jgi:AraC-like DNA-binding protein
VLIRQTRSVVTASVLLHRDEVEIADLGFADLGFADQSHLCRVIRSETGLTPSALRRALA